MVFIFIFFIFDSAAFHVNSRDFSHTGRKGCCFNRICWVITWKMLFSIDTDKMFLQSQKIFQIWISVTNVHFTLWFIVFSFVLNEIAKLGNHINVTKTMRLLPLVFNDIQFSSGLIAMEFDCAIWKDACINNFIIILPPAYSRQSPNLWPVTFDGYLQKIFH